MRNRTALIFLAAVVASTLAVGALATASATVLSTITATPDTATLPVGTQHTIVATVVNNQPRATSVLLHFDILSGPDAGLTSAIGGSCSPPACTLNAVSGNVSWSFINNGAPGTDVIEVCAIFTGNDVVPEEECTQNVSVTWVEPRRVGAFPAAIIPAAAQSAEKNIARANAPAVAPAVSPPSTGTGIAVSPPNTGDAGLKASSESSTFFVVIGMAAFALAGLAGMRFARR